MSELEKILLPLFGDSNDTTLPWNIDGIMDARKVLWILDGYTKIRSACGLTFKHCSSTKYEVKEAASTIKYKMVNGYKVELESGKATFTATTPINIHDGTPTGKIVGHYKKGNSVKYWGKYVGNGHRYVVYTSWTGKTRFVAVNGKEDKSEPWATFSKA